MTKRQLTPAGQMQDIKDQLGEIPREEPVPPPPDAGWRKEIYIATRDFGVFYTQNFVTDTWNPAGVPTWATINTGLNLAFDCVGFRGDPFQPADRQFCLMEDGVYRREFGGNWVCVLTWAAAQAAAGGDMASSRFGYNALETNINREGRVDVIFNAVNSGLGGRVVLFRSNDYGTTWTIRGGSGWGALLREVHSLTIGAYQGTSPYPAGTVLYGAGRFGSSTRLWRSLDDGVTWTYIPLGLSLFYPHVLVDPNDQSRVFAGSDDGVGPYNVQVSLDHAATIGDYDTNASEACGAPVETWYHLSVAMEENRMVRIGAQTALQHIHTTRDDGNNWEEVTPQYSPARLGISLVQDSPNYLYLLRQISGNAATPPQSCHVVFASEDEGRTMVLKAGANACTAGTGGGNSIPYDCGGVRGILQIWTDRGEGDIPGLPVDHDLGRHPGEITWPQLQPSVGTGAQQVAAGSHAGQHEDGGADEIDVAGLSGVLADEQDAGWLKGRVISAAAPADGDIYQWNAATSEWEPVSVIGDLEEARHVHIYKENLSALCDGVRVVFFTANEYEEQTLRVSHQRDEEVDGAAEDYVEDALFNSFTMAVAPAGGDKLVAHYLAAVI